MFFPTRRYAAAAAAACFAGVVHGQRVPVSMSSYIDGPFVSVAIGTPPQLATVLFDSGSPLLWTRGIVAEESKSNDTKCPLQYDPSTSSTAELVGGNTSFSYGGGYFVGPSNTDSVGLVLESTPELSTTPMHRNNVTSATTMINMEPICDKPGIIGMNQGSQFMKTYFANQQDAVGDNTYYVANFNMEEGSDSWFEIGSTDVNFETSKCSEMLPLTQSDRLTPPSVTPGQPNATFTFWWQFTVDKFKMGDKESSGKVQTFVDDGTSTVLGNFASIFSPDPVPDDLCAYLCENDATFDFVLPDTGGEAISLGIEELMYYDASSGEKNCLIGNVEEFPETLIIAGLPFYNKYFIKHDYADGGQVCFAEKSKYPRLSTSSEICPLLLSPSDDDSSSASLIGSSFALAAPMYMISFVFAALHFLL